MNTPPIDQQTPPPADTANGQGSIPASQRPRRRVPRAPMVAVFLSGSFAAGVGLHSAFHPPELVPPPPHESHHEPQSQHAADPRSHLAHDLHSIDTLLRAGYFQDALNLCHSPAVAHDADEHTLAYREALA